jgi:hypothetical protein
MKTYAYSFKKKSSGKLRWISAAAENERAAWQAVKARASYTELISRGYRLYGVSAK